MLSSIRRNIYIGDKLGLGSAWTKIGNVSLDSPDCVKALTSVLDMWCMCNGPFLTATRSLKYLWVNPEMHIHRERTNSPSPIRSPLSLVVVWSGSHSAVVFMSAPGTCQPSSCTWCLWTVYISHRTCPVDSPSALSRDKNTNNLSIHTFSWRWQIIYVCAQLGNVNKPLTISLVNWNIALFTLPGLGNTFANWETG